jgi:hypothetical protein
MAITRGVGPLYITLAAQTSNNGALTGTTAGRSIIIVLHWYDPSVTLVPTITISGESNATLIAGSKFTNQLTNANGQIAYLANIGTGGNKTITVTFGGSVYADVAVMEYAGLDTSSQPDASTSAFGTTTATTTLTTTTANALIVAGGANDSGDFSAGSGYTLFGGAGMSNGSAYSEAEDQLDMGSAAPKTVAFTGFGSNWAMTIASFKAAGGGAANWGRLLGMETNRLVRVVG